MKKFSTLFLTIVFFIAASSYSYGINYKIIKTPQELNEVIPEVKAFLRNNFGIILRMPLKIELVSGEKLDALYNGAYRGAEIGLYLMANGRHEVYIMENMNRDEVISTLAHEMVHAWQAEVCNPYQDIVIKEGFARWVEYKILLKIGAYIRANLLKDNADPIYGTGFKKMLEWENIVGEKLLPVKIREIKTINDVMKKN